MNRALFAVIAGLALVAGLVLWMVMSGDDPTPAGGGGGSGGGGGRVTASTGGEPRRGGGTTTVSASERGTQRFEDRGDGEPAVREYEINGVKVRDHRTGTHAPIDLPPNTHAPGTRRIASKTTGVVSNELQKVVRACGASIPREARGEKPRLEGRVIIAIKAGQVSVTSATVQLRNIEGAAAEAAKQCVEQKSVGLSAPVADEADLDAYSISLSFAII